jgi:hypothetical protein
VLKKAAILHTNGGGAQLFPWWGEIAASGSHVGAHYQVFWDGRIECYVDPALVIYHAFSASEFAIGIETEDDGTNTRPWTQAQMLSIAQILMFHGVPAKMLTSTAVADGVGFHEQYSAWNGHGHVCPGSVREAQIPHILALMQGAPHKPDTSPIPAPAPGDDVAVIICSPGKHNPRLMPAGAGEKIGAPMSSQSWGAWSAFAAKGGAKIVVMDEQADYDQIVADLS